MVRNLDSPEIGFEAAADAIVSGDVGALKLLLGDDPDLVQERSRRTHRATLLHYVTANGVEDSRQRTPANIIQVAKLLLDSGADVNATCDAYGGSNALGLAATSVHPERAGLQDELLQLLIDYGAQVDQVGLLEACLANGRGTAARYLASRGARVTLETAAGTGRLDLVRAFLEENVESTSSSSARQLQRGFVWACMFGRHDVAEFLLNHGADLNDRTDTGATALHWAAAGGHLGIVRLLIGRKASLESVNRWGGTVLQHVGWAFENGDPELDLFPVFRELLAAGARVQDGWLLWLDRVCNRTANEKARLAELLTNSAPATKTIPLRGGDLAGGEERIV